MLHAGNMRATRTTEQLWHPHFADPSQWWDNRLSQETPKLPDFIHKRTLQPLWVDFQWNPPWVKARTFATMPSSHQQMQSLAGSVSRQKTPSCNDGDEEVHRLCEQGRLRDALHLVRQMVQQMPFEETPKGIYIPLLKACARRKALTEGKQVHALMVQSKSDSVLFLANKLIDMYSKCGSLLDACAVFNAMPRRNVISWTAIISAYVDGGKYEEAIDLFKEMQKTGIAPDKVVFGVVLKACARTTAIKQGKHIHSLIVKSGLEQDTMLRNILIDMYAKCKCLHDARQLFDNMSERNVFSWNTMIGGYAHNGLGKEALVLYEQMKQEGMQANKVTFISVLKACANTRELQQGKEIHSLILENGFNQDVIVESVLVDMYAKCGCLEDARRLFNNIRERDVVSWNVMIAGYAQNGFGKEALALYKQMKQDSMEASKVTLISVLKACADIGALEEGKQIHAIFLHKGFDLDVIARSTLVDMYAKCGCLEDARELFNNMRKRDVISWNAMIAGYVHNGLAKEALALYVQMKQEGVQADIVTFLCVLKACASTAALEQGKQIHLLILENGLQQDLIVQNALVDMYAKCGCLEDACQLFNNMSQRDVVSWTAMISGYIHNGLGKEALALYEQMKQEGVQPDIVTFVCVLKACGSIAAVEQGKQTHSLIIERGFEHDVFVQNVIIDMYAKCGCIEDARQAFNIMRERNVVSWTAMIAGYVQNGLYKEALALYEQMKQKDMQADIITFVCVLKACGCIAALEQGKQIHSVILEKGFEQDVGVQNALVDMYAKCGCLDDARRLFNNMSERDAISWNTMIAGYAQYGLGKETLALYQQMEQECILPNAVTYVSVLSACSHCGLVEDAFCVFDSMFKYAGVTPILDHYACMVDLLCRAWLFAEAEDLITKMPMQPNSVIWMSLLGAARIARNTEIGEHVFHCIVKLEPENAAPYLLLIDIYAAVGQMEKIAEMRKEMSQKDLRRMPVNLHPFVVGDESEISG